MTRRNHHKGPDIGSTIVAGLLGALILPLFVQWFGILDPNCVADDYTLPKTGFLIGAGVQTMVRVTGVS